MTPLAFGDTEGQPVACYDATAVTHAASQMREVPALMADTLEEIRRDYFDVHAGDPGAIVAVLVTPVDSDADHGLVFVAADGPLGGCGEASMFAAMLVLESRPEVRLETGAGLITARSAKDARVVLTMPPGTSRVDVAEVDYEGKRLRVRTVSVGGNVFAAVSAAELAVEISAAAAHTLTERGSALLKALSAGPARPNMLLLTTPVKSARTTSAVIWGDAILNLGPCGTGTCARYILAVEDGDVVPGSRLVHVSPFDNVFTASSVDDPGGSRAIQISGRPAVTG
ncbi:proline racemase family protein [Actinocrispum wychmicini]|uniref:Proline racemase n=1 Tax=Actinocrispum wychmicini TaxID=1213861 RepID=A0A4R2JL91_9PSEU|nr:proline racemase family protein [Actinocrispum wychmicini]TCO59627.1 proline racemase [Actinocrispum wychmicini]